MYVFSHLQSKGDRDGASFSGQVRVDFVNNLGGISAGNVVGVVGVCSPGTPTVTHFHLGCTILNYEILLNKK